VAVAPVKPVSKSRGRLIWMAATAICLAAALIFAIALFMRPSPQLYPERYAVPRPEDAESIDTIALSPDGKWLAITGQHSSGLLRLWLYSFEKGSTELVKGAERAQFPFWSPDSRSLGFFADRKLKVMALGAMPQARCAVPEGEARGGACNHEGIIVFGTAGVLGLYLVPAAGGDPKLPTLLYGPDPAMSNGCLYPSFLPDDRHFLFSTSKSGKSSVLVGSIDSQQPKYVLDALQGLYASPGYIIFEDGGALFARSFDLSTLEPVGVPSLLVEDFDTALGWQRFSVSEYGTLAYVPGRYLAYETVCLDRSGKKIGPVMGAEDFADISLSRDDHWLLGRRIGRTTMQADIWVLDVLKEQSRPLTSDPSWDVDPVWSSAGKQFIFTSRRDAVLGLYVNKSLEKDGEKLLFPSEHELSFLDWSPDSKFVLHSYSGATTSWDLWWHSVGENASPNRFIDSSSHEIMGRFSPDGKWIAYVSDETQRNEVWVARFPGGGNKTQISRNGGISPRWRQDMKEIFCVDREGYLTAIPLTIGSTVEYGEPETLFPVDKREYAGTGIPYADYDVSSDGRRFAVVTLDQPRFIQILRNWPAALPR